MAGLTLLALPIAVFPGERCAGTFAEVGALLGRQGFARAWREVSMNDGKPLVLRIVGDGAALRLAFVKTDEGLWAEGPVHICVRGARVKAEVAGEQLKVGPAAGWAVRQMLAAGAIFELTPLRESGRLRISAGGWSGDFESFDAGNGIPDPDGSEDPSR